MAEASILLVDDDPALTDMLALALSSHGFAVAAAGDGERALAVVSDAPPDAIILDVMLPRVDGFEVCRRLRASGFRAPILMLTSRDDEIDKIVGLEIGADDYVTKPFSARELVARIHSALRRARPPAPALEEVRRAGVLVMDRGRREVFWLQRPLELTATEFELLWALLGADGRALGRDALIEAVYGPGVVVTERTIDTFVKRIRAKIQRLDPEFSALETVRAVGYRYRR